MKQKFHGFQIIFKLFSKNFQNIIFQPLTIEITWKKSYLSIINGVHLWPQQLAEKPQGRQPIG